MDFLLERFKVQYISVMTNLVISNAVTHPETGEVVGVNEMPLTFSGYLLDDDNNFLYIGDTPDSISHAIKKEAVVHISKISEDAIHQQALQDFVPDDELDIN